MKDLIIGCLQSYYPHMISVWVNSILHSGFEGDIVVINFGVPQETVDFLKSRGVIVVDTTPTKLHIVVDRFINVYQYLQENQGKYRYVISTDLKDIVFQDNPIESIEVCLANTGKNIIVASENIFYKDEGWGNENLKSSYPHMYDRIKDKIVFNAGVIMGEGDYVKDFCLHIYHLSLVSQNRQPDQAAMNILMNTSPFDDHVYGAYQCEKFVANLGTTLADNVKESYKNKWLDDAPIITSRGVVGDGNVLFSIVHQYDRVAGLWDFYQSKFGSLR